MDKLSQRGNTHNKCWITKICIHTKVNEKMDTSEKVWNTTTQLIIFLRCSTIDHLIGGFLFWITQKLPHFRVTRVFIDKGGKPPKEGKMPLWSKCVHTHHWNKCVHTHHYRNISTGFWSPLDSWWVRGLFMLVFQMASSFEHRQITTPLLLGCIIYKSHSPKYQ